MSSVRWVRELRWVLFCYAASPVGGSTEQRRLRSLPLMELLNEGRVMIDTVKWTHVGCMLKAFTNINQTYEEGIPFYR